MLNVKKFALLSIFMAFGILSGSATSGQNNFQRCPICPPTFQTQEWITPQVKPLEELGFSFGNKDWRQSACRVLLGNGCGSGSFCGIDSGKSYVLTNAHVAGTKIGVLVKLRFQHDEKTVEYVGRVVMAAYSSRYQTDWALLVVDGEIPAKFRQLSMEKPNAQESYVTHGSPRCVWPQVTQALRDHKIDANMPWWTWLPNSIGGQSGSGVWNAESGIQYGLLTWSANGRGAGQQTAEIYRQAKERTNVGEDLPESFKPVTATGVVCEDGFFAETGITDLPIWANQLPKPQPEPLPPTMDESEKNIIAKIREINQARRAKREAALDWLALIQLILKLIEIFGEKNVLGNAEVGLDVGLDVGLMSRPSVALGWESFK